MTLLKEWKHKPQSGRKHLQSIHVHVNIYNLKDKGYVFRLYKGHSQQNNNENEQYN